MDRKVIWSAEALSDLESVFTYIVRDSHFYAAAVVREIWDASRSLTQFAQRGRMVPEYGNPHVREIFVRGCRLIYAIDPSHVSILTLIHGKRDLKKFLSENR